jgi:hypothetical protein
MNVADAPESNVLSQFQHRHVIPVAPADRDARPSHALGSFAD